MPTITAKKVDSQKSPCLLNCNNQSFNDEDIIIRNLKASPQNIAIYIPNIQPIDISFASQGIAQIHAKICRSDLGQDIPDSIIATCKGIEGFAVLTKREHEINQAQEEHEKIIQTQFNKIYNSHGLEGLIVSILASVEIKLDNTSSSDVIRANDRLEFKINAQDFKHIPLDLFEAFKCKFLKDTDCNLEDFPYFRN